MFFQIIAVGRCFGIDLNSIDVVQMEDSGDLEDSSRYSICFYKIGVDSPSAVYNLKGLPLTTQMELFDSIALAKQHDDMHWDAYKFTIN